MTTPALRAPAEEEAFPRGEPAHRSAGPSRAASPARDLARLPAALVAGLRRELRLTPKPGLVDLADCGSHPDLSLPLMERSILLVGAHLRALRGSVERGEPLAAQVALGRAAERRMLAALGTNTHRGALFLGGLVVVGAGRAGGAGEAALRAAVAGLAARLATGAPPAGTHGAAARRRHRVGGILGEAAAGLPSVFEVAVPALRSALARGEGADAAAFLALGRLMQVVEDTTALHRCGRAGLDQLRRDGARLERLVAAGAHLPFLQACNARWRRRSLTMGGVADLLGVALGWLVLGGELPPPPARAATASPPRSRPGTARSRPRSGGR